MKNVIIVCVCIVAFLCCTACHTRNNIDGDSPVFDSPATEQALSVYVLSRASFEAFLEDPSYDLLMDSGSLRTVYSGYEQFYLKESVIRFPIEHKLTAFVGDLGAVQQYLEEHGFQGTIRHTVFYDAPNIPLTLWVQTDRENVYITVNEEITDEEYTYRAYSQTAYYERYVCKDGTLYVEGECIATPQPVKIYHDNADVPFLSVVQSLGGVVERGEYGIVSIRMNDQSFLLNLTDKALYAEKDESFNLFDEVVGGSVFIYEVENELMVDWNTLQSALSAMGEDIRFYLDREDSSLTILKKS